jgi:hypothetical protein
MIFPVVVIGSVSTNAISRGYSCAARRTFTCCCNSRLSASLPVKSVLEHDEGLHDLGALRIGHAHDSGKLHGGMGDQTIFDGSGSDAIAGAGDDVVVAADELNVAAGMAHAGVAGEQPVADILFARSRLVVPITEEHDGVGPAYRNVADATVRQHVAFIIDDATVCPGAGLPIAPGRVGNKRLHETTPCCTRSVRRTR